MHNFVDIQNSHLPVSMWISGTNYQHSYTHPKITQLVAPIHFYTYEQAPTITTTKTNKQSKTSRNRSIAEYL